MKLDLPLYEGGMKETVNTIDSWLNKTNSGRWIATVNPEFVMQAEKDRDFLRILRKTDLNVVDGIGLVWAKEVEGVSFGERLISGFRAGWRILGGKTRSKVVGGADLINELCSLASERGYGVFFLGGWEDRAERTAKYFLSKYPKLKVVGHYGGKSEGEDEEILKVIENKRIDMLFVAFGMKKQELWIARNLNKINVGVAMGVGRTFDYYSGDLKRAPLSWRNAGLEWLYSLIQEPKRWKRQLELPKFIWKVLTNS